MKSSQFCTSFSLVIVICLALSKSANCGVSVFDERPPEPEPELQCATPGCCFGPTPIPSTAQLEIYVLSYESADDATLGTSATRAEVVAPLTQEFLEEDIVDRIANRASSYGFATSVLVSSQPNACQIPINRACKLQKCGCPDIPIGRRLLQCLPFWGCQISSSAPVMDGSVAVGQDGEPVELDIPDTAVVAICLGGSCSIFRFTSTTSGDFIFSFNSQCPNLSPLPTVTPAVFSPPSIAPITTEPDVESPETSPAPSPTPPPAPETFSKASRRQRRRNSRDGDTSTELSAVSFSGGNGRPLLPDQASDLAELARSRSRGLLQPQNPFDRVNVPGRFRLRGF